jgi:hypothetical protein
MGSGQQEERSMQRELIKELVQELTSQLSALVAAGDYGSVRVYASFLSDAVIPGFADVLLTSRETLNDDELILVRQMLHNPLLEPLAVRPKIEQELTRRGHP